MSLHRRAAKRDASELEIVDALQKRGWSVLKLSVKDGPDLIAARIDRTVYLSGHVSKREYPRTVAIECKTGKRKLRPGQRRWMESWPGEKAELRTAEEALAL